jgi:hypothetical protein
MLVHPTSPDNHSPLAPTTGAQQVSPTASYPHLAATYQGTAQNITVGQTATLTLTSIVQDQQVINGNVIIGPGLVGSGPFAGTITKDGKVSFTDIASDGSSITLTFTGSVQADGSLNGTYTADYSQQGIWHATPA